MKLEINSAQIIGILMGVMIWLSGVAWSQQKTITELTVKVEYLAQSIVKLENIIKGEK